MPLHFDDLCRFSYLAFVVSFKIPRRGGRSRDRMVVRFITTNINVINEYQH